MLEDTSYKKLLYKYDLACAVIGQKPMFYQSRTHRKRVCYCFLPHYLYVIKQMKKLKLCITL